ncbi:hypothetical protein A1O3_01599 [Capronia epimyces CBS 606.96]|uniref:Zn(2)-C6 fungal-type domain-containing protein n=1 Tax=Capronia epimyces CBS 606.96 TaxID=1182542 RepID=W9YKG1_9EURO|nr:uncharacterized protein A1O3_01599 [Capronia epimyces CBS 606.96]EXJ93043.1 hypothetical protein A1O3_01599 [Capronia epimyces CBS 606.96]
MAEFASLTHKFRANIYSLQPPGASKISKRNRQPLSCGPCRLKKLKCDRGHPCETCIKKGDQRSCTYGKAAPAAATARPEAGSASVSSRGKAQERLQHLEQLVMRMVDGSASASASASTGSSATSSSQADTAATDADPGSSSMAKEGHLHVGPSESRYVGSTHWSAILEDIQELKTTLGPDPSSSTELDESVDMEPPDSEDLFGPPGNRSLAQILAQALPPRLQVDRRLSMYFKAQYLVIPFIHSASFQRRYEQFWNAPLETPPLWISLLFSICSMSATLSEALGSEPSTPEDQPSPRVAFLAAAGQCIQLGGYVRPKRYAVEALALYSQCKYLATLDPSREVGIIFAIVVRLAYRSGYHRDPSLFAHISVFEGEMRRRTWAMCRQFDLMASFQLGLPNLIPPDSWDTQLPRNLLDADFDEHTTLLPPSRREDEATNILYFIVKSRLMTAFGKMCSHALSFRKCSQTEIMALDAELRAVYATVPEILRIRPMAQSFADPPYLVMVRLNCEFLYQKSICVLHRKYMTQGGDNSPASTQACLDAAATITKHMLDLHKELQPGGQLYAERWMLSSFVMNDFYLACMVLCLGVSLWKKANPGKDLSQDDRMDSLFKLLKAAFTVCEERKASSTEARRVGDVLRVMLGETDLGLSSSASTTTISQLQEQPRQQLSDSTGHLTPNALAFHPSRFGGSAFTTSPYDFNLGPSSLNEENLSSSHQSRTPTWTQPGASSGVGDGGGTDFVNFQQVKPRSPFRPNPFKVFFAPSSPTSYQNTSANSGLAMNTKSNGDQQPYSDANVNRTQDPILNLNTPQTATDFSSSNPAIIASDPTRQPGPDRTIRTDTGMNAHTDMTVDSGINMDTNPNLAADPPVDIDWAFLDQWMALPNPDSIMASADGPFAFGSPSMPFGPGTPTE